MKILIVQPTCDKRGHYGIWTTKMCQNLAKKGHSVTLCTNRLVPEKYLQEKPLFRLYEVEGGRYNFEKFDEARSRHQLYYFYGYFSVCYHITKAALSLSTREGFDVIFITDAEFLLASLLLKRFSGRIPPVVMQVNAANFSFTTYAGSVFKKLYKVFQRSFFRRTLGKEIRGFAVLGEWHRERLRRQLRLDEDFPIDVVPDAGDEPLEFMNKYDARRKLGIDYAGDILLFFGMLRKDKGIGELLEAMRHVRTENYRLLVVGAPTEYTEEEVRDIVKKNRISDRVILRLEYVADDEVPAYFFAADALVLPYSNIYTGGSGPLLKGACTYRRPVIVTDVSEMGRLTRQHGIGLLARPGDPHSLAEKMDEFLAMTENEREEMAKRSSYLAKLNSWGSVADRFVSLFNKVRH